MGGACILILQLLIDLCHVFIYCLLFCQCCRTYCCARLAVCVVATCNQLHSTAADAHAVCVSNYSVQRISGVGELDARTCNGTRTGDHSARSRRRRRATSSVMCHARAARAISYRAVDDGVRVRKGVYDGCACKQL